MIFFLYKIFRKILFPVIFFADFLQNNLTSIFTPMNMGPVSENNYSLFIKYILLLVQKRSLLNVSL